jgi:hypothetical protein
MLDKVDPVILILSYIGGLGKPVFPSDLRIILYFEISHCLSVYSENREQHIFDCGNLSYSLPTSLLILDTLWNYYIIHSSNTKATASTMLVPIMLDKVAPVFMFLDLVSCHVLVPIMLDKVDPVFIFLELVSCHVLVPIMLDKVDPVFMFLDLVWKSF